MLDISTYYCVQQLMAMQISTDHSVQQLMAMQLTSRPKPEFLHIVSQRTVFLPSGHISSSMSTIIFDICNN